jgi:hypothetical protein
MPLSNWFRFEASLPPCSFHRCSEVNGALVLVTVYGLYYVILEAVAGATWLMIIGIPMFISATWFCQVPGLQFEFFRISGTL